MFSSMLLQHAQPNHYDKWPIKVNNTWAVELEKYANCILLLLSYNVLHTRKHPHSPPHTHTHTHSKLKSLWHQWKWRESMPVVFLRYQRDMRLASESRDDEFIVVNWWYKFQTIQHHHQSMFWGSYTICHWLYSSQKQCFISLSSILFRGAVITTSTSSTLHKHHMTSWDFMTLRRWESGSK
jgi:hypothetical protein